MVKLAVAGIVNEIEGENIFALLSAISLSGVFCAFFICGLSFLVLRNSYQILALLGVAVFACLTAVFWMWSAVGCGRIGIFSGPGYFNSALIVDSQRLQIILLMAVSTVLVFILAYFNRQVFSRLFISGILCAWSMSTWIVLLNNGLLRAFVCFLFCMLLLGLLLKGLSDANDVRKVFFSMSPLIAVCFLWCISEITGLFTGELRLCAALLFLFLLPFPGHLLLWKKGAYPGIYAALVFGPLCGLLLLDPGTQMQWLVVPTVLCALVAGAGAAVSNHLSGFVFFACISFLHQNIASFFLGDSAATFCFISFYPLIVFGLFAVLGATQSSEADFRFKKKVNVPLWLKGVLFLFLIASFSGLVPGGEFNLRLNFFSRLQTLKYVPVLFTGLFLLSEFFLLLGILRSSGLFKYGTTTDSHLPNPDESFSEDNFAVPKCIWFGLGALLLAAVNPFYLPQYYGVKDVVLDSAIPWYLFVPVAGAFVVFVATPREESIARIWSGVSPEYEQTLCNFTSTFYLIRAVELSGSVFCFLDRLVMNLFHIAWKCVFFLGRFLIVVERGFGIFFLCVLFLCKVVA